MPRTIWTKPQSEPNGMWRRHEGEPPFSIPAPAGVVYDVLTDTGESFVITPLTVTTSPALVVVPTGPDTISVTSSEAGTCYYGWYPVGTDAGSITIANMIAGTDTAQQARGTAGVFTAAGELTDIQIPFTGLLGEQTYVLALVVDIDDSGSYTNLALQSITTPALVGPVFAVAAAVDANTVIVAHNEDLFGTEAVADWAFDINGAPATITNVSIVGNAVTLTVSDTITSGSVLTALAYTPGDIANASGNPLSAFSGQAVTNNVPATSTALAEDTFTVTNGTSLIGLVADTGGTWSAVRDNGAFGRIEVQGNVLEFPGSGSDSYYALSGPSAQNVAVTADLTYAPGGGAVGLLARVNGADGTFEAYLGRLNYASGICQLYVFTNGTPAEIGASSALGLPPTGSGELVLRCSGTTIEVDWNGSTVISVTDETLTGAGSVGIGQFRGDPITLDNLSAQVAP